MGIVSLLGEKQHFIVFYANLKALRAKSSLHIDTENGFPAICRLLFYPSESSLHLILPMCRLLSANPFERRQPCQQLLPIALRLDAVVQNRDAAVILLGAD